MKVTLTQCKMILNQAPWLNNKKTITLQQNRWHRWSLSNPWQIIKNKWKRKNSSNSKLFRNKIGPKRRLQTLNRLRKMTNLHCLKIIKRIWMKTCRFTDKNKWSMANKKEVISSKRISRWRQQLLQVPNLISKWSHTATRIKTRRETMIIARLRQPPHHRWVASKTKMRIAILTWMSSTSCSETEKYPFLICVINSYLPFQNLNYLL